MSNLELTALTRAAASRRRAEQASSRAISAQEDAVRDARAANHSWAEIGEAMKVSEGQAKWLGQRSQHEAVKSVSDTRAGRGPGVGVSAAARALGVTRRTVYLWIDDGRLKFTKNEIGRIRVLLPETESVQQTA